MVEVEMDVEAEEEEKENISSFSKIYCFIFRANISLSQCTEMHQDEGKPNQQEQSTDCPQKIKE